MRTVLKNVSLLLALVVVVYLVANYAGTAKTTAFQMLNIPGGSVKGASTERAQEISEKFKADISVQLGILEEQALNITFGDAINGVMRLQKIPQDFQSVKEYMQVQADTMLKSRK